MLLYAFFLMLTLGITHAETGEILQVGGGSDAYIIRGPQKIKIQPAIQIEKGDEISNLKGDLLIWFYPSTQISMAPDSRIKFGTKGTEIDLLKGIVRVRVMKFDDLEMMLKIFSSKWNVTFSVLGTEFETGLDREGIYLNVFQGEIEVSSPLIHTFVPEIVRANEGLKFSGHKKQYVRRKVSSRFKNHSRFLDKDKLAMEWKKKVIQKRK